MSREAQGTAVEDQVFGRIRRSTDAAGLSTIADAVDFHRSGGQGRRTGEVVGVTEAQNAKTFLKKCVRASHRSEQAERIAFEDVDSRGVGINLQSIVESHVIGNL